MQKQPPEVFYKKGVLKNFAKFTKKRLYQSLLFNKVVGPRPATLLKRRLWYRCFPVNFAIFRHFLRRFAVKCWHSQLTVTKISTSLTRTINFLMSLMKVRNAKTCFRAVYHHCFHHICTYTHCSKGWSPPCPVYSSLYYSFVIIFHKASSVYSTQKSR